MSSKLPMLTLNGLVMNVFDTAEKLDQATGEVKFPAASRVQIQAETPLENGQTKLALQTLKVQNPDAYRKLQGKFIRVPVGAMADGRNVIFFALKSAEPVATS